MDWLAVTPGQLQALYNKQVDQETEEKTPEKTPKIHIYMSHPFMN